MKAAALRTSCYTVDCVQCGEGIADPFNKYSYLWPTETERKQKTITCPLCHTQMKLPKVLQY